MNFVAGRKVISAKSGNAGFLLILDNGSWASAFRTGKTISYEFGSGKIDKATLQINSTIFGDATDPIKENRLYAKERNNIQNEIEKSYGKTIESLAIGINTFNFAFEDGMELDFQLCNDKNGIPSIRVFWEQW